MLCCLLISMVRAFSIWTSEVFTKKIFYPTLVISYSSIIAELSTCSAKAFSMLIYQFPKESDVTFFCFTYYFNNQCLALKLEFAFLQFYMICGFLGLPSDIHFFFLITHYFNMFSYIVCI